MTFTVEAFIQYIYIYMQDWMCELGKWIEK